MSGDPPSRATDEDPDPGGDDTERDMAEADEANGEGSPANDTEARYGEDESPA